MLRAHRDRLDGETTERLAWAWYVARLSRVKHMPSLAALISPTAKARPSIEQSRSDHAALLAAARNN